MNSTVICFMVLRVKLAHFDMSVVIPEALLTQCTLSVMFKKSNVPGLSCGPSQRKKCQMYMEEKRLRNFVKRTALFTGPNLYQHKLLLNITIKEGRKWGLYYFKLQ